MITCSSVAGEFNANQVLSTHVKGIMAKFVKILQSLILFCFVKVISADNIYTNVYDLTFNTGHSDDIMNQLYDAFNCDERTYPILVQHVISGPLPEFTEGSTLSLQLLARFHELKRLAEGLETVPDLPPIFHVTLLMRALQVVEIMLKSGLNLEQVRKKLTFQVLDAVLKDMDRHGALLSDRDKSYQANKYSLIIYLNLRGAIKLGFTDEQTGKYHPPPRESHETALQLLYRRFDMLNEAIFAATEAGHEVPFEMVKDDFLAEEVSKLIPSANLAPQEPVM